MGSLVSKQSRPPNVNCVFTGRKSFLETRSEVENIGISTRQIRIFLWMNKKFKGIITKIHDPCCDR